MTKTTPPQKPLSPQPVEQPVHDDVIIDIGQTLTRMRFLTGRRIVGRIAIANVAPGLELTDLDVLDVSRRIAQAGEEVTVGAIADAMRIDPSRGSRLVADLVTRGILRRDASQEDGRRSLIAPTELGNTLLSEIRSVKHGLIEKMTGDWSEQDRQDFARLFARFVDGFEDIYQSTDKAGEPAGLPPHP
ncbi:MarR family transcriptional regulator [Rhizobiales bacterium RZME27]|uniref:MarR family transcriptional regulator n=1 Tax=Endobacterium cereale TaxID=2663029 RepID=A0A6A8A721_9HYPH|nr:MarR family winged helix-turn-helix transcriptional regulator [Endobacterium cereale]MEB2844393.1 MarR family winged helix-turn-helix transcriptional regulator [Endobacterium cereale]MQY46983.1 MarR family transcriptional regulator [Endobacterium cereale]